MYTIMKKHNNKVFVYEIKKIITEIRNYFEENFEGMYYEIERNNWALRTKVIIYCGKRLLQSCPLEGANKAVRRVVKNLTNYSIPKLYGLLIIKDH
jgi:hypothetical protein